MLAAIFALRINSVLTSNRQQRNDNLKMADLTSNDIKLYSQQFDNLNKLLGKPFDEIIFYLDETDKDFSEVQNAYGKSLLTGIDLKVGGNFYSIGCRFTDVHYGLTISEGRTSEFEFIEEDKSPVSFSSEIVGQTIKSVDIFWMKIPIEGATGYYPQEFLIRTDNNFFLISSIEINNGEVNTEFTNEILIIEKEETARQLKLGQFGIEGNGREHFSTVDELIADEK